MTKKERNIRQIIFMCKLYDIDFDKEFILYVYNQFLPSYSGEKLKQLKIEYNKAM